MLVRRAHVLSLPGVLLQLASPGFYFASPGYGFVPGVAQRSDHQEVVRQALLPVPGLVELVRQSPCAPRVGGVAPISQVVP